MCCQKNKNVQSYSYSIIVSKLVQYLRKMIWFNLLAANLPQMLKQTVMLVAHQMAVFLLSQY